jgi:hypothetical protein
MAPKRARITDRDPLTATDGVLAGYEQVNKSASQQPESEIGAKGKQVNKPTSKQVNKLISQSLEKSNSRQDNKSTSQDNLTTPDLDDSDNLATEEVSKLASQLVDESDNLTSQLPDKLASQEVDNLEMVSSRVNLDNSASQQSDNLATEEVGKLGSQLVDESISDKPGSQQASKPTIRKATFQVDAVILEALDRYHLQLQIEMGRRNAPYKEILVEEAIAQWLERAAKSPDRAVKSLLKRQEQR